MAAHSEQIKNNFLNNPYAQQVCNIVNGQVSALDAEVCLFLFSHRLPRRSISFLLRSLLT